LGGDGLRAPFAAYAITGYTITGDATSGRAEQNIFMDPRFCSLVSYLTLTNTQATVADADFKFTVGSNSPEVAVPRQVRQGLAPAVAAIVSGGVSIGETWEPPPFILPGGGNSGFAQMQMANVDTDVYIMTAFIYLFNIRVRELSSTGGLLWQRGSR